MQIEVTLAELNSVVEGLNKLVETPMPAKYAFRFGKVAKQLQGELQELQQQRNELYKKYGEQQENGSLTIPPAKVNDFYGEVEELLKESVNVNFEPMPLSAIGDSEVSIATMAWLDKFFVDDLNPDEPAAEVSEESQEEAVAAGA